MLSKADVGLWKARVKSVSGNRGAAAQLFLAPVSFSISMCGTFVWTKPSLPVVWVRAFGFSPEGSTPPNSFKIQMCRLGWLR